MLSSTVVAIQEYGSDYSVLLYSPLPKREVPYSSTSITPGTQLQGLTKGVTVTEDKYRSTRTSITPGTQLQEEYSYSYDTTAYGTIPYIDLRDENLDGGGLSSMDRMCVKTD